MISKLDDRSTPGVFIGYTEGSKAYRILDPGTQRVRTARDVVFNEGRGWAWDKAVDDGTTPTYDDFTIEYVHFEGAGGVGNSSPSRSTPAPKSPPTPAPRSPAPATTSSSPPRLRLQRALHHHALQPPLWLQRALCHHVLQHRRYPLRECPLRHQLVSSMTQWSS
jgi:hypothetical protein